MTNEFLQNKPILDGSPDKPSYQVPSLEVHLC